MTNNMKEQIEELEKVAKIEPSDEIMDEYVDLAKKALSIINQLQEENKALKEQNTNQTQTIKYLRDE